MTIDEMLKQMEPWTEIRFESPTLEEFQQIDGRNTRLVPGGYWRATVEYHQITSIGVSVVEKDYAAEDFSDLVEEIWKEYSTQYTV